MRRFLAIISVTATALLLLVPAAVSAELTKVAVIWITKSTMISAVQMGFSAQMSRIAPDVYVELHRQLPDMVTAEKNFRECEQRVAGIVFLGSYGAEFLAKEKPKVPCFIGACNDPISLGVVKDMNAPEGVVTGVTYYIPHDKRFQVIKSLFPQVKSVLLLLTTGHPGSKIEQAGTQRECEKRGIRYQEVWAANTKEMVDGVKAVAGKADLIIISNTRVAMDNVVNILPIANASKTPMFSYARHPVERGAVAGLSADDVKLGGMLADSVVDVIVKKKPISKVPVKIDPEPKITVNRTMMQSLGLQFPDEVMKQAEMIQ